MIFGENLLALLVLALGAALAVGNLLALVRPRIPLANEVDDDLLPRPPLGRSLMMIGLGTLAAVWALVSLTAAPEEPIFIDEATHYDDHRSTSLGNAS